MSRLPRMLPMASEVDVESATYDVRHPNIPTLRGFPLAASIALLESPLGPYLYPTLARQAGVQQALDGNQIPEKALYCPHVPHKQDCAAEKGCKQLLCSSAADTLSESLEQGMFPLFSSIPAASDLGGGSGRLPTVADYYHSYRTGERTPEEAMEAVISFLERERQLEWFISWSADDIRRQAKESTARLKSGTARSILEGVPFAIKDCGDAPPYGTTAGTTFMEKIRPVSAAAPPVAALQSMGAVLLGKTSMHEVGLGVTGLNRNTGTARNPWNQSHYCGGSSSGSAAVVAAGICPFALGTDGGGSIRIPSTFCGIIGLKPTHGRLAHHTQCTSVDETVSTWGPMAGCVADCALLYAVMERCRPQGSQYLDQPADPPPLLLPLPRDPAQAKPLQGMRIGVYWEWFNDCDDEVRQPCRAALTHFEQLGANLISIVVPELHMGAAAHSVTIASEIRANLSPYCKDYTTRRQFNPDVRLTLSLASEMRADEYLKAQKIRARMTVHFQRAFQLVDVIVTPGVPCVAPTISDDALSGGELSTATLMKIMRYTHPANFVGLPGLAVPLGLSTTSHLPVSFQLLGRPWEEASLLRLAAELEASLDASRAETSPRPPIYINPLQGLAY